MTRLAKCSIFTGAVSPDVIGAYDVVVVIDNLRATSTIVTACSAGVREIIPVADDDAAFSLRRKGYVIAGESDGVPIPGYDTGNSPLELLKRYAQSPFRHLVLKTSNLTPLLLGLPRAFICSSLNLTAVSRFTAKKNTCIVAAGSRHGVAEDLGVAFALAATRSGVSFDMSILTCFTRESRAARHLRDIGFGDDVEFIAGGTAHDVLPFYDGRAIRNVRAAVAAEPAGRGHED